MGTFPVTRVYPITDVRLTGLSHAEQVARLIEGGAVLVQLREKHLSPQDFFSQAVDAIELAHSHGVKIIINDRLDIALAAKANGVHLGQDDMPPQAARALLGDEAIIGYSTHNVEQALSARDQPIDYLAIGPIFSTSSKKNPDPLVGLSGLQEICDLAGETPVVAIGGITSENIRSVLNAGANCVALINALLSNPSQISSQTARLISNS